MTMTSIFKLRGDTLANWLAADPILHDKEVVLVATDSGRPDEYDCRKTGDGRRKFSELPLLGFDCLPGTGESRLQPMSQKATTEAIMEQGKTLGDNIKMLEASTDKTLKELRGDLTKRADGHDTDILELQKAVWPLELTFEGTPLLIKAGTATEVSLSWRATRGDTDVTAQAAIELDHAAKSGKSMKTSLTLPPGGEKEMGLTAAYAGMTARRTLRVKGTLPTYFGTVAAGWTADATSIKGLTETLEGERRLSRSGITLSDGRIALAYPKDFGALTSAKDGNGYETLGAYSRSEVTVNDHAYYCYVTAEPVTAKGVTQTYS